jgi:hypothetical protein
MLVETQKNTLKDEFKKEMMREGVILPDFEIDFLVEEFYRRSDSVPGNPVSTVNIQEPRVNFDVENYNSLIKKSDIDLKTINSFFKKSRLQARNLLIHNDVNMKAISDRANEVAHEIENFENNETVPNHGIKKRDITLNINEVTSLCPDPNDCLSIDTTYGSIHLEEVTAESQQIQMPFDNGSVTFLGDATLITSDEIEASLANLAETDSQPWTYKLSLKQDVPEATIYFDVQFNTPVAFNTIQFTPTPGISSDITVERSITGVSFTSHGKAPNKTVGSAIHSELVKAKALRFIITSPRESVEGDISTFIFSMGSIKVLNNVYSGSGTAIISNINPGINNRPIVSVALAAKNDIKVGTNIKYEIATAHGTQVSDNSLFIQDDLEAGVNFNVASIYSDTLTLTGEVNKNSLLTKNSIDFSSLDFTSAAGAIGEQNHNWLGSITELRTGVNVMKVKGNPSFENYQAGESNRGVVHFGGGGEEAEVYLPMIKEGFNIRYSSNDFSLETIELPLPAAFDTWENYTGSPADVEDHMRDQDVLTSPSGVFKIERYDVGNRNAPAEDLTNKISSIEGTTITMSSTATTSTTHAFRVVWLAKVSGKAFVTRGSVRVSDEDDEFYNLGDGEWQFNYGTNKLIATPDSSLINTTAYVDMEARINDPQLAVYECFIYNPRELLNLELNVPLVCNELISEYISLQSLSSKEIVNIQNKSLIEKLAKGWHKVNILSKPLSNQDSAIKSFINAKDTDVLNPKKVFNYESRFFTQIGTRMENLNFTPYATFINSSRSLDNNYFSYRILDNKLKLVIADTDDEYFPLDGGEKITVAARYFPDGTLTYSGHSRLNLKIEFENISGEPLKRSTSSISELKLRVSFI